MHEVGLNGWKMRSSALLWMGCAREWENELKVNISSTGIYCRIIISMTMTMMFWSGRTDGRGLRYCRSGQSVCRCGGLTDFGDVIKHDRRELVPFDVWSGEKLTSYENDYGRIMVDFFTQKVVVGVRCTFLEMI